MKHDDAMGYIDNNLITGEVVTHRARLHWILFVQPPAIGIAIFAPRFFRTSSKSVLSFQPARCSQSGFAILIVSTIPFLMDRTNKERTVSLNTAYGALCAHVLKITIRPFCFAYPSDVVTLQRATLGPALTPWAIALHKC
jgi:hypothetical protein